MIFTRVQFNREDFARSLDFADAAIIARECFEDTARVYQIDEGAHFIARKEDRELVVVALEGANLRAVATEIAKRAQALGFQTIRFHTRTPAIARLIRHLKPRLREYVYEVRCSQHTTQ